MTGEARRKAIPIGVRRFQKIREGDYYYVDKTELISDILAGRAKVILFTRPRRFGKSLNLSMLDAFFNRDYAGNTWFDGLKVSEHVEVAKHKNSYPVIHLDMNDICADSFDSFISDFSPMIADAYRKFDLTGVSNRTSPENLKDYELARAEDFDTTSLNWSICTLCQILKNCYGVAPIVLIDECDKPLNDSFDKPDYEKILSFLRDFYSSTLKSNEYLSFAVLTGIMRITERSITSGLNNLKVDDIFSNKFDERYGFTPEDVQKMCSDYGHPEKFEEAKEWYGGYRFGDTDIYNPWSILNYVDSKFDPKEYWTETGGNDIVSTLISHADSNTYEELQTLAEGGSIGKSIRPSATIRDIGPGTSAIYSVMVMAGHLNAIPSGSDRYRLSIPNMEIGWNFKTMLLRSIHPEAIIAYDDFFDGMESMDLELMKIGLNKILANNIPFFGLSGEEDHQLALAAAAMSRLGRYIFRLEDGTRNGKTDICMTPNRPELPNIVFEIKKSRSTKDETLGKTADKTIGQIKDKEHCFGMRGRTILYGICFNGKKSAISVEELNL